MSINVTIIIVGVSKVVPACKKIERKREKEVLECSKTLKCVYNFSFDHELCEGEIFLLMYK